MYKIINHITLLCKYTCHSYLNRDNVNIYLLDKYITYSPKIYYVKQRIHMNYIITYRL